MQHVWKSKWTFILAAIGSAAGLGNLWRFPFQVYDHGGAVFIVAYLILLCVIGLGLLFGEIAYGQRAQSPAPQAFALQGRFWSWIGWAGFLTCLAIVTYYSSVIGWSLDYLRYSIVGLFDGVLPWVGDASGFFYGSVLQLSDGPSVVGGFSKPVVIAMIAAWILIYLFTRKSAHSVGKVVWVTATLPFVFLLLLTIRALTLPGSSEGFALLTQVDWSRLGDFSIWLAAAGQIFFSLSIGFGMMLTYGAMKKKKSEIMGSASIILLGDTLTSLMSAILVFATLGFMAQSAGVPVTEVSSGGPGLAFVTIPEALAQIPYAAPLFALLFFATIFFLAIDSAMAMVESVVNPLKRLFNSFSLDRLTLVVCVVLGALSLFFARQNGLYLLDVVDNYINTLAVLVIALAEVLVFIFAWKPLTRFMLDHSDGRTKKLFSSWYFLVIWIATAGFLLYTLGMNLVEGIWSYDTYEVGFLRNGVGVVLVIFMLSLLLQFATQKPSD